MNAKQVSTLTSNIMVAKDGFEEKEGYISKNIKSEGQDQQIMFRQNKDHVELINVTKNEMLLDKYIGSHDPREAQKVAKEVYGEVKEKIASLENQITMKPKESLEIERTVDGLKNLKEGDLVRINHQLEEVTGKIGKPVFVSNEDGYQVQLKSGKTIECENSEIKRFANQAEISQFQSKDLELDKNQITKGVRVQLKQEGKVGADFGKTKNGIDLARGDYIKLNENYSHKDSLLKSTEVPKGAEVKITGYVSKQSETYATGTYNNREVQLKVRDLNANYGDQYLKRYESNPAVKQAVDKTVQNQKTDIRSQLSNKVQELNTNSPKLDKPTTGMKY